MSEEERTAVLPSASTEAGAATPGPGPEPLAVAAPIDVRSVALSVMAVLAAVLVLQYARSVFIPIVLGILVSYTLDPIVAWLQLGRVPRSIGAAVAVTLLVGSLGLGVYTLSDQAMAIVSDVPRAAQRVRERVREHRRNPVGAIEKVQQAATEIDKAAKEAAQPAEAQKGVTRVQVIDPVFRASDYLWAGGMGLINVAAQFVLVLFLVYFFLVTGDLYKRKLVKIAGPSLTKKRITVQILGDINRQIEHFMRVQVVTSLVVGAATAAALWWFGVNRFIVWGLLAGLFNSIPYLGPVVVTGALAVVTFMQFDDVLKTAYVCGTAFAITTLEGFLLTPMMMSRASRMNPVAVFLGLLFWSWIWGVWGTVLAVPMMMMLKAVCDHVEDLQPIGELLGE
jgi:predicted PurR-regulated permease PerM